MLANHLEYGTYKGFYQFGEDPRKMSWFRVSDAVLELRPDGFTLGEDPDGDAVRLRGLPTVDAGYDMIEKVEVRPLGGSPLKALGLILGATLLGGLGIIGRALRRSANGFDPSDIPVGGIVAVVAVALLVVGAFVYISRRKWVVMHFPGRDGGTVAAAVQLKKIPSDYVAAAIAEHRHSASGRSV